MTGSRVNHLAHQARFLVAMVMVLAGSGCAALRPSRPAPARSPGDLRVPTAEINEGRLTVRRKGTLDLLNQSMAAGRSAQVLGWFWEAGVILDSVASMDEVAANPPLLARVLLLRGLVALHLEEEDPAVVGPLLSRALELESDGSMAEPLELALDLLGRLSESRAEVLSLRKELATLKQAQSRDRDQAKGLRMEMEALRRQLEELKEVHLQLESEKVGKKEDPSP
ncbi:MAG: hypothetical protein ACE5ID_08595 [Acidobacteriota bacterium]